MDGAGAREQLAMQVRTTAEDLGVCDAAQLHLAEILLRERLAGLAVEPTPDLAVALMAVATLLAQGEPEFGGDSRDVLGQIAQLGLRILEP
jgi:hypothetical protein